jgi:hypothetical protein
LLWIESLIAAAICNLIIRDQIVGKKEQTLHGTVSTASRQKLFDFLTGLEGTGVTAYRHLLFGRYRTGQFWWVPVREIAYSRTLFFSCSGEFVAASGTFS